MTSRSAFRRLQEQNRGGSNSPDKAKAPAAMTRAEAETALRDAHSDLQAARSLPAGAERFERLRKAGRLRYQATERLIETGISFKCP